MKKFHVVKLLQPQMCEGCKFNHTAELEGRKIIKCTRKACDNHAEIIKKGIQETEVTVLS